MRGELDGMNMCFESNNPSERFSKLLLPYLAGFFDGEGWISIRKNNTVIVGVGYMGCPHCKKFFLFKHREDGTHSAQSA